MTGIDIVIYLLTALHITVCVILIAVVLFQQGKGADLASAFGGGSSQTAFGARQATTLLSKLTTAAAVVFMVSSLSLAITRSLRLAGGGTSDYPEAGVQTDETGAPAPAESEPEAASEPEAPAQGQ